MMKLNKNPEYPHSQFAVRLEHMEGKDGIRIKKSVSFKVKNSCKNT
jgi:hypothetical protein